MSKIIQNLTDREKRILEIENQAIKIYRTQGIECLNDFLKTVDRNFIVIKKFDDVIFCPSCGVNFAYDKNSNGKIIGIITGAITGAYFGAGVGIVAGPIGGIAGTIPGAIIGAFSGSSFGSSFDNTKCPKCDTSFKIPQKRNDAPIKINVLLPSITSQEIIEKSEKFEEKLRIMKKKIEEKTQEIKNKSQNI